MHSNTFIALFAAVAGIASAAPSSGGSPGGGSDNGITPSGGRSRLSPEEIEATMKEHNRYRNACGMTLLQWDDDLGGSAQAWADKMPGNLEHSDDGPDRPGYGENLAWSTNGDAGSMTKQWTDEAEICSSQCSFNHEVGHYTQIVWEGTQKCGCAIGPDNQLVCHYYPAGNVGGQESTNVCPKGLDSGKLGEDFNNDFKSGGGANESPAGGDKGGNKPETGKESPAGPGKKQGQKPESPAGPGKKQGQKPAPPADKPAPPAKSPEKPTRRPQKPNKEHEKPKKQHQRPQKPDDEDCDEDQSPKQPRPAKQRPQRRPQRPQKPEEDCDDDDKSSQKPNKPSKPVYEAKEAAHPSKPDSSYGNDDESSSEHGRGGRGGDHGNDSGSDKGYGGKSDEDCDESKKI